MSIRGLHDNNNVPKLIPVQAREGSSLHRFPSACLPNVNALQGFSPGKNGGRPSFDPTSLMVFGSLKFGEKMDLPYFEYSVSAGYPTSVEDPFTMHLDIGRFLTSYPGTSYYFKVTDYSMVNAGINHKDLLVVDTALKPKHRDVVIAVLNGEHILKRLFLDGSKIKLLSANPDYPVITITKDMEFFVQGVVTTVIRTFNPLPYDNHFKDISYSHQRDYW